MLSLSLLAYEVMKNDEKVCWFDVMKNYETWILMSVSINDFLIHDKIHKAKFSKESVWIKSCY